MHRTRKTRNNNNNIKYKYKKKKSCKRKYKKNINGINGGAVAATLATLDDLDAHITAAAGNLFTSAKDAYKNPYVAWPLTIYDAQRATKALVKNINEVYKFYLYCKTINKGNIDCPELLRRFTYALHQLGKNIKILAESGLVAKIIKIIDSKLTKSDFVKEFDEMNTIITELSRDSTLATPPSTFINRVSNTVMVGAYADWYRYELYIYANNLHMIVSEIMSVKISGVCVSEADIIDELGKVRQSVIPAFDASAASAATLSHNVASMLRRRRMVPDGSNGSSGMVKPKQQHAKNM